MDVLQRGSVICFYGLNYTKKVDNPTFTDTLLDLKENKEYLIISHGDFDGTSIDVVLYDPVTTHSGKFNISGNFHETLHLGIIDYGSEWINENTDKSYLVSDICKEDGYNVSLYNMETDEKINVSLLELFDSFFGSFGFEYREEALVKLYGSTFVDNITTESMDLVDFYGEVFVIEKITEDDSIIVANSKDRYKIDVETIFKVESLVYQPEGQQVIFPKFMIEEDVLIEENLQYDTLYDVAGQMNDKFLLIDRDTNKKVLINSYVLSDCMIIFNSPFGKFSTYFERNHNTEELAKYDMEMNYLWLSGTKADSIDHDMYDYGEDSIFVDPFGFIFGDYTTKKLVPMHKPDYEKEERLLVESVERFALENGDQIYIDYLLDNREFDKLKKFLDKKNGGNNDEEK